MSDLVAQAPPVEDKKTDDQPVADKATAEPTNNPKDASDAAAPSSTTDVPAPVPAPAATSENDPDKLAKQLDHLTIFGNKSLDELHKIQSQRSHLSVGILFTDPSLKM
jgi:hypothetical protein